MIVDTRVTVAVVGYILDRLDGPEPLDETTHRCGLLLDRCLDRFESDMQPSGRGLQLHGRRRERRAHETGDQHGHLRHGLELDQHRP